MDSSEWFEFVRKSRLVDDQTLSTLHGGCATDMDVRSISARMIDDGLLTGWQAEKLLQGRWKGFFIDHYCIRRNLGPDNLRRLLIFEAMDIYDKTIVVLEIVPPSRDRRTVGGAMYSVKSPEKGDGLKVQNC